MALTGIIGEVEVKVKGYPINDKTNPNNRPPKEAGVRTVKFTYKSPETDLDDWQTRMALLEAYIAIVMDADL